MLIRNSPAWGRRMPMVLGLEGHAPSWPGLGRYRQRGLYCARPSTASLSFIDDRKRLPLPSFIPPPLNPLPPGEGKFELFTSLSSLAVEKNHYPVLGFGMDSVFVTTFSPGLSRSGIYSIVTWISSSPGVHAVTLKSSPISVPT